MNRVVIFILFLSSLYCANGEELKDLQKQRKKIETELKYLQSLLYKTQKDKNLSIGKLTILNKNIKTKQKLITHIQKEVNVLNSTIKNESNQLEKLKSNLVKIKKNYVQTIQQLYIRHKQQNQLVFILSSKNFNQAYRRLRYLKQYTLYAKKQAENIIQLKQQLDKKINNIKNNQKEKNELLKKETEGSKSLLSKKTQQISFINNLKQKESKLKANLKRQKKLSLSVEKKIRDLIAKDVKKSKGKDGKVNLTTLQQKISGSFKSNKGNIPWPTLNGFISSSFGEHRHPVLKNVKIRNDGIDITTDRNSTCKAVFDGRVSEISNIPGLNNIIMIRHGNFLSVYINIISVIVKKGDTVKQGQSIGTVSFNPQENFTILKFQLWEGNNKLNPTKWLKKL